MEVTRARFGSLLEWAVAAACVVALGAAGSWLLREARRAPGPVVPVAAEEFNESTPRTTPQDVPAVVPEKAVSVPLILLSTGSELRLGESESVVTRKVSGTWKTRPDAFERTGDGTRVMRGYDDGAKRFLLMFEPATSGGERHLSGIYVQ